MQDQNHTTPKKSRLKKYLPMALIAVLLLTAGVSSVGYYMYINIMEEFRYRCIRGNAIAIEVYVHDYDGEFPGFDQWCDKLIAEVDCAPRSLQGMIAPQEGVCGYALNENLRDQNFSELPDKMVLAFEAKGPWNLIGGPELMKQTDQKKIAVVYIDGYGDFVTIEEVDNLKWEP